jgi:hypothetical protein
MVGGTIAAPLLKIKVFDAAKVSSQNVGAYPAVVPMDRLKAVPLPRIIEMIPAKNHL